MLPPLQHSTSFLVGSFYCGHLRQHLQPFRSRNPVEWVRNRADSLIPSRISMYMELAGVDSDGKQFDSARDMWKEQIGDEGDGYKRVQWYREGVSYWEGVEASVDGVLGGYECVNDADIMGSEAFLSSLLRERLADGGRNQQLVALDCGSGIGRIAKNLLIRYFNEVDLLEPVSHFLNAARENLSSVSTDTHKPTNYFCVPLQEFAPEDGRYDVIWIQWCIGHLADDDFISFFKRARNGLKPDGFFVLKENIAKNGFVLDKEDHSVTRSDAYFKDLFRQCGLHLYKVKDQKNLPKDLFAVKMYALAVDDRKRVKRKRAKSCSNRPGIIR